RSFSRLVSQLTFMQSLPRYQLHGRRRMEVTDDYYRTGVFARHYHRQRDRDSQTDRASLRGRPVGFRDDDDVRCRSEPGFLLARAGPPREVIGQHIDRDRGQAHHDPDPEDRGMMDSSPIARLHSVTSWGFSALPGRQIVGSTENRSPASRSFSMSGLAASSRSASTRADDGPRRQAAIMVATAPAGPANTASTLPSRRLRTQPSRSRDRASCSTK